MVSVEIHEELHREAAVKLADKGVANAELYIGDVMGDWQPEQAHDVVVVTGSVADVPEQFLGWVNPGGRMFVVRGHSPAMEELIDRLKVVALEIPKNLEASGSGLGAEKAIFLTVSAAKVPQDSAQHRRVIIHGQDDRNLAGRF